MKLLDKVQWTSSAGGTTAIKIGTIVGVVPTGKTPTEIGFKMDASGRGRRHESYLVMVEMGGWRKPKLYWPVASLLKIIH